MRHPLLTQPCTLRLRATGEEDEYGDTTPTWSDVQTWCELQQQTTNEVRDGALVAVNQWRLFLPYDSPVLHAADEVRVSGETYAAEGDAWQVRDPLAGIPSHVECRLRKAG